MAVLDLSRNAIKTARLVLRPLRADDDARLYELFANWEVMRFLSSPPWPYARKDARAFVRSPHGGKFRHDRARDHASRQFIGLIGAIIKPAARSSANAATMRVTGRSLTGARAT
jgi:RimJ/RimL family protein N-acetyltransferase